MSKRNLSVLYLGPAWGTSLHRADALRRLGCDVVQLDPRSCLPASQLVDKWIWRTGGLLLENVVRHRLLAKLPPRDFRLVVVDCGSLVSSSLVRTLKQRYGTVVNYNNDDPFGKRDAQKWRQYRGAVPEYDLVVVVRESNVAEAREIGAREVLRVTMSADEVAHTPGQVDPIDARHLASEVLFIGTWMPERGPFLGRLIELGVPLTLYGDRWQKASEWHTLSTHWRGEALMNGRDYARTMQSAKVCLGLLSRGNRDESTQRSFEIPLMGGVLCAERTPEHMKLYRENEEAVFWSTPEECAEKCKRLLADSEWRNRIARKGRERCIANGSTNEVVMEKILNRTSAQLEQPVFLADSATV